MCNNFNKKFLDEAAKAMQKEDGHHQNIHHHFMDLAISEAITGIKNNEGGPFGCLIVKDGKIIGRGNNKVTSSNDPTAHAEIEAIRNACKKIGSFQLEGCIIYTSCEPCPMCMGAIYWARPDKVYFGCDKKDAANIGFDDDFIYQELPLDMKKRSIPFEQINKYKAIEAFEIWNNKEDKTDY